MALIIEALGCNGIGACTTCVTCAGENPEELLHRTCNSPLKTVNKECPAAVKGHHERILDRGGSPTARSLLLCSN
eukprot:scaffold11796_cov67-Skeletonema_dohrnii-CCMP3373.AAC.1